MGQRKNLVSGMARELPRKQDMAFVGGQQGRSPANDGWLQFLKDNPQEAREMGRIVEDTVQSLQMAYPGEIRERTYSNDEWKKAGYDEVAEVNALLGLKGR